MENQPISNPQDSQQLNQAAEQNPVPKQKTNIVPIIITALFTAIIFGSGGYFYGSLVNKKSNLSTESNIPSPSPLLSPKPSGISLVSYIHPEKMYELKYPSNFIAKEWRLGENANSTCQTELILAGSETEFDENYQGNIVIDVCKAGEQYFPDAQFSNIDGPKATQITINGNNAYVKTGELVAFKLGNKFQIKRITTYKEGYAYTLDLRYIPGSPDYSDEFDIIVSNFVFTN